MADRTFKDGFDIKKAMLGKVDDLKEKLPPFIKETVENTLKKDGIVIGVSGGVDSALIATLAVEALGNNHVYGLILPEKESSPSSRELAMRLCKKLKIPYGEVPITPMLESFGIYTQKEALIRELFPLYDPAIHTTNLFLPPGISTLAEAFRKGNMGIMDYYRMKNILADTQMRDTIGRGGAKEVEKKVQPH